MKEPLHAPARQWDIQKRYAEAERQVSQRGWTQKRAAEWYGVDRTHLSRRMAAKKKRLLEQQDRAQSATEAKAAEPQLRVSNERRRVPPFNDFEERYFGHLLCPDCGVRHATPPFHDEITAAVLDPASKRVLVNMPPYHSKSTLVTVKHTIYELVRNPNSRTILISKSLPFTRTFLQSVNEILTNHELYDGAAGNLIDEWGPFKPEGSSSAWSKEQIYVAGRVTAEKDPTIQVLGVGQQIYGRRADRLVFDDIATLENQANPDRVASMLEWIDKEALSRIGKNGLAVWVGTRVHHGDVYSVLQRRAGYKILKYPCILDDATEATLWPEHFPFSQALVHREEMSPADFQLVYQQVDIPGVSASFPPETVDECKDTSRTLGQFDPSWRMIGGLDPAGASKDSGYTALTVIGVDVETGKRFLVDQVAEKAMKAPRMKDLMLEWSRLYAISEWRVEVNGLQSQLIQYDQELIKALALAGTRVVPHKTGRNKWDPQFGVEGMAPLMTAGLFSIPWGNAPTAQRMQPLIDELIAFPMGRTSDRVMSLWFCDNGARDLLRRDHLPMFNERLTRQWPARVKRRRGVVDFEARQVRRVPLHEQRPGALTVGQRGFRRIVVGDLTPHAEVGHTHPEPNRIPLANVEGWVEEQ
jgi:phage terminase large subunit-like protein